jgi:N12 class adenine-specific DNA methylase
LVKKLDLITDLYTEAIKEVSASPENWLSFLRSACRNYRLPFDEQLLIYKQRPSATAVLEMKGWNQKFGRWVKQNSKGIAVFDKRTGSLRLKYYFDISDTKEGNNSCLVRPVPLWEVGEQYQEDVKESLANAFDVSSDIDSFEEIILSASKNVAEDNLSDYMEDILTSRKDSSLERLDESQVGEKIKNLLSNSVAYMVMIRCGIQPENYFKPEDFINILELNTPELINQFGVVNTDVSGMMLSEIADTIKKLKLEEKQKKRTFAENRADGYNQKKNGKEKNTVERGVYYDKDNTRIQQTGRISSSKSDRTVRTRNSHWEIWITPPQISGERALRDISESVDTGQAEPTLARDTENGTRDDVTVSRRNETGTKRDRGIERERSDVVDSDDGQHTSVGRGNSDKRINIRLEWYDRSSEDKSLPIFGEDEDIKSLLLSTPHLKANTGEIKDFFETHEDKEEWKEYIRGIFNHEPTEIVLKDGRRVGYKTYQNVLHMWEGNYLSRASQSYYDWGVIAEYFEGMRLLGELKDHKKYLPTVEGQLNFMKDLAEDHTSAFSFSQEIIDTVIKSGNYVKRGKYHVYAYFLKNHTNQEKADFLKNEYGFVSAYSVIIGTGIDMLANENGLQITRNETDMLLKWGKVAKRIDELIKAGRYLTEKEMEALPEYEKSVLTAEIYHFYSRQPEEVVRPYPYSSDYHAGMKAIRPQIDNPERLEEILVRMAETLNNTVEFDRHYKFMKKVYRDVIDYRDGKFSLFSPIPAEIEMQSLSEPEPALEQAVSTDDIESLDDRKTPYDLHPEAIVYIGMEKYKILSITDNMVVLHDFTYPLFTKDMPREEFEQRVRENPANDHLKGKRSFTDPPAEKKNIVTLPVEEEHETDSFHVKKKKISKENLTLAQKNYRVVMELAPEVLNGELDSISFKAGQFFMPLTIESIGEGRIAISHYYVQNGDSFADPDMEFVFDHEAGTLNARTFQQDSLNCFDKVVEDGIVDKALESKLNKFASQWFRNIREQGYVPIKEENQLSETEGQIDFSPVWEKEKPTGKIHGFDLYPEILEEHRNQYQITNDELGHGTPKEKFRANIAAIQLLKKCEDEGRYATPDEQELLSRYVGWGGLSDVFDETKSAWKYEYLELKTILTQEEYAAARQSTLTAFYTPPIVIRAMYQVLENMGLKSGNILEPSCAVGNFIGMKPKSLSDCNIYGVEIDSISGRIAQQLYQKSTVAVQGYEEMQLPDNFFDVAIGNVPFGQFKVFDRRYEKHEFLIHDYFFAKTLDKVRTGGVIAFITSSGTMDKKNLKIRKYISQRAEFLGAIRLPNNTFQSNAGTEVTADILFLKKRDRLMEVEEDWLYLDTDKNGITQNSYFVSHPEMILGEMETVTGAYGLKTICRPYKDDNLDSLLQEAITNIHAEIKEYETSEMVEDDDHTIPADPSVTNYSYTVLDGQIYYRENSRMKPIETSITGENRIKSMVEIRDCVRELIAYQMEGYSDYEIERQQKKLNHLYNIFSQKYGLLNGRANSIVFSDDSGYPLLCSLEIIAEDGTLKRKADMFTKRTIKPHEVVSRVNTASEALALSLAEKVCVNMEYMCLLTGKSAEEIEKELTGIIFRVPDVADAGKPQYVSEDEYLSGNVREKLRQARIAAQASEIYKINVEALEKVQPKDLSGSEINIRLGATWIPEEDVKEFLFYLLETRKELGVFIKVHFSNYTGEWNIEGKSRDRENINAKSTYGTSRVNAYKIVEDTLNLRDTRVYDYTEDEEGKRIAILNKTETAFAQEKQELIKQQFQDWIWKDSERRERLVTFYNEHFNAIRPREYNGSHLKFYGMNPEICLRKHQINGAARIIYGGNTLLAYVVGAGKTYTMAAAAMESKRLGLCNKSMVVVPNHIIEQFANEWLQLYPAANLLVTSKKDFEKKNRKKFCARIATSDLDAVIIGHSQFEKIPLSIERQREMLKNQIREVVDGIRASQNNDFTVKQLEKSKKSLEVKLSRLNDQSKKDNGLCFEELGIDRLFVDEADCYKNLYLYTKMRNVGGIAQTEAQKSSDMFMKCRYLDDVICCEL